MGGQGWGARAASFLPLGAGAEARAGAGAA